MLIRTEAPADILAIDRLLKSVFETDSEANLVMALRENSHRTLSLVACDDEGEIVGYVLFTPVTLNGQDLNWQGLAPLAVEANYRCQGLGAQLVNEGLASLGELGYPACVVLGDPNYYQRFGFSAAQQHGFHCPWSEAESAFQVVALWEDAFTDRQGLIEYCAEFSQVM